MNHLPARTRYGYLAGLVAALLALPGYAAATDFPVTGTLSVNGNAGALPEGTFAGSSYDAATGAIAAGAFEFAQSTASFDVSGLGTVVVTYLLGQTDTSTGLVEGDGGAALSDATLQLRVVSATLSGFPLAIGTCVFEPIVVSLAGTASSAGLDLSDEGFTIPEVAATDCGGYGSAINDGIAGSDNAIQLHLAGDFTPPGGDAIFVDGFDSP